MTGIVAFGIRDPQGKLPVIRRENGTARADTAAGPRAATMAAYSRWFRRCRRGFLRSGRLRARLKLCLQTLLPRQFPEALADACAGWLHGHDGYFDILDACHVALLRQTVERRIAQDASDPCQCHASGRIELACASPNPDKRFLDGVFGQISITQNSARGGEHASCNAIIESAKRTPIALPDEVQQSLKIDDRANRAFARRHKGSRPECVSGRRLGVHARSPRTARPIGPSVQSVSASANVPASPCVWNAIRFSALPSRDVHNFIGPDSKICVSATTITGASGDLDATVRKKLCDLYCYCCAFSAANAKRRNTPLQSAVLKRSNQCRDDPRA